jgi:hypothetical protein
MKSIKMLGLSLAVALVATALLGAGSASATVLCKKASSPCGAGNAYPAGTQVNATLATGTTALISFGTWSSDKIECSGAQMQFTSNAEQGFPLTGTSKWSINSGCLYKTLNTTSACSVYMTGGTTTVNLNSVTGTNNGKATISGEPLKLAHSCTPIGVECRFSAAAPSALFELVGGNPATVKEAVHLTSEPSVWCPPGIDVSATYTVTSPNPLYVTAKL